MPRELRWKAVIIAIVFVAGFIYLVPTFFGELAWWRSPLPQDKIQLGLDLQGGMYLVLEVEAEKAVESAVDQYAGDLKETLASGNGVVAQVTREEGNRIRVTLLGEAARAKYDRIMSERFRSLKIVESRTKDKRYEEVLELLPEEVKLISESAVEQGLETIRNRIDQFGVAEPVVQRQGDRRIVVQLPGIKDPERAIKLIGKTALLEFKLLDESMTAEEALAGQIPEGDEILYQKSVDRETGRTRTIPYLLKKRPVLTGEYLRDARIQIESQFNRAYVSISFNEEGARIFERVTGQNVDKRLAIVLDNVVHSAPVIQERIAGGRAQITGLFTTQEAGDLAIVLRAGALPAPVTILEKRTVGPSLGRDSIRQGLRAMLLGGAAVIAFMLFYYRLSGSVADLALLLNVFLIGAALSTLRATLTMPGIAGIILTTGMAVDANVLIFERIREELKLGKTIRAAVKSGFSRAFLTILDSNITTFIAALVLFQFGTGPVKGFGITLMLGILASLFTAVFVGRFIFDLALSRRKVERLSI